jgi:hypothetical protein
MTFIERPMPTDAADACVWRSPIGASILNEGFAGASHDMTSETGGEADRLPLPFFSAGVTTSQFYQTSAVPQFNTTNGLTMSLWFCCISIGGLDRVMMKQNQSSWVSPIYDTALLLDTGSNLIGGTVSESSVATGPDQLQQSEWVHAGVTVAPGGLSYKFFLRGVLIGGGARSLSLGSDLGPWVVGGRASAPAERMIGAFWDARVAIVERSAEWFQQCWERGVNFLGSRT